MEPGLKRGSSDGYLHNNNTWKIIEMDKGHSEVAMSGPSGAQTTRDIETQQSSGLSYRHSPLLPAFQQIESYCAAP